MKCLIKPFSHLIIFFAAFSLQADEIDVDKSDAEQIDVDEETHKEGFNVFGFIDGAYTHMDREPEFASGVPYITNDTCSDCFAIHQLTLTIEDQSKEGLGFSLQPVLGQDAFQLAPNGLDPDIGLSSNMGLTIINAYGQYSFENLTLYAGLMEAFAGFEPMVPVDNLNFSRSIISSVAVPDTVTGLRATYAFNPIWQLGVGVNNGWDTIEDTSRPKTVELSVDYTPSSLFYFNVSAMHGGERASLYTTSGPTGERSVIDSFGMYQITSRLSILGEYNYGWQTQALLPDGSIDSAKWQGIAGYLDYKFNKHWYTTLRAGIFDDVDGYLTGVTQVWKEATLTVGYFFNENILVRAEARHDLSNTDAFVDTSSDNLANNQQLFALEAYYKF